MNSSFALFKSRLARSFVSLLAVVMIAACSSQTPAAGSQTPAVISPPTATQPAVVVPNTGPTSPAPALASPTLTPAPQASATPAAAAQSTAVQTTASAPDCKSPAALTPAQTEGPYFKANSPERTSLIETSMAGTRLVLTGYVLTADCKPVAHALLDFWQADDSGQYDNSGYTLRGHQFSDDQGRYQLVTVIPGLYTGRTEHIHVKVQAPNGPVLTSQLYFPDVASNQRDGIFNPTLLVKVESKGNPEQASFNFIIQAP
jgi:protocatechuate 3,4-dioxygenase beta subunit